MGARKWLAVAGLCLAAGAAERVEAQAQPPVARRIPKVDTLHGDVLRDDYHWLRQKTNPEVRRYLEAENGYTDAGLAHTTPLRDSIYREILGRVKETDLSVPWHYRGYWYYERTEKGKSYSVLSRKRGSLDAPEEVILDENELADRQELLQPRRLRGQPRRDPAPLPGGHHRLPRVHAVRQGSSDRQAGGFDRQGPGRHGLGRRQPDLLLHPGRLGQAAVRRLAPPPRHARRRRREGVSGGQQPPVRRCTPLPERQVRFHLGRRLYRQRMAGHSHRRVRRIRPGS